MKKSSKKPIAYILHGFVGAGKTTFAKRLEEETGAVRFTNDEWMIRLYGKNPPDDKFSEYYERTNTLLHEIAFKCLRAGVDVIFDAGFWTRKGRDEIRKKVTEAGADYQLIWVKTPNTLMEERVLKRNDNSSEQAFYIDKAAVENFKTRFEPLEEDEECVMVESN
jgi:predicted kinase